MAAEERLVRTSVRRSPPYDKMRSYFVGRRESGAAVIYEVAATSVERLRSSRPKGEPRLDWHGSHAARMELAQVLISRVTKQRASRDLQARFALYVLNRLPEGGFVIESEDLWRWVRVAGDADDSVHAAGPRSSRLGRMRARFGLSRRDDTEDTGLS